MSAEPIVFDPEVEALLRRIAADPDSSLLRVTRPQSVKGLFERTERVSVGMTGLSSAERELVRVHRHEVAYLLREVCRWRLMTDKNTVGDICPFGTTGARYSSTPPQGEEVLESGAESSGARDGLLLFHRCITQSKDAPSTASVALAAFRLEPSASARMYIGLDLTLRGRPHSALRVYDQILKESVDPAMRSIALSNAGLAYEVLSKPRMLFDCYAASAQNAPHPLPALEWLFESLRREIKEQALRACRVADGVIAGNPSLFRWYMELLANRRVRGVWTPTSGQQAFIRSIHAFLPSECRRMVDAFA